MAGFSLRGFGTQLRDRLDFTSIPALSRVSLPQTDYVKFLIPDGFPVGMYEVAVTTLDSTAPLLKIGDLRAAVRLPNVVFDPTRTLILVLPKMHGWTRFSGNMYRGKTYQLEYPSEKRETVMRSFGLGF
jgi:hypothetical protein